MIFCQNTQIVAPIPAKMKRHRINEYFTHLNFLCSFWPSFSFSMNIVSWRFFKLDPPKVVLNIFEALLVLIPLLGTSKLAGPIRGVGVSERCPFPSMFAVLIHRH